MFGRGDEKVENKPAPDNSKQPRKRRTQLEIADAKEKKGNQLLDEAKAIRDKVKKAEQEKQRKSRLYPVAGMLLKIIDDLQLPEGVTDADFMAALRIMVVGLRRRDDEDKQAFHNRVAPAIEALFGNKDQRDPVREAAMRVLVGSSKAPELVSALRKPAKKSATKQNK